jgi:hypothetical protein
MWHAWEGRQMNAGLVVEPKTKRLLGRFGVTWEDNIKR